MLRKHATTFITLSLCLVLASCSGKKKKEDEAVLSELTGKKVALVHVEGETTAKKIVEVALINQLITNGSFEIIPKQDVEKTRTRHDINPTDYNLIAKESGADYALTAKIIDFEGKTMEGYSSEEVEDSLLEEERGDGNDTRLYKVESLKAHVAVDLAFTDVNSLQIKSGRAEHSDEVKVESKNTKAHLPPKLRFLETVANQAFKNFFETYQ